MGMIDTATSVDWDEIKRRKQKKIRLNNEKENASRIEHTYQPGDEILIKRPGIVRKLAIPFEGPYRVVRHSVSRGSITYEKSLTENDTVNVRRVYPYHRRSNEIISNTE